MDLGLEDTHGHNVIWQAHIAYDARFEANCRELQGHASPCCQHQVAGTSVFTILIPREPGAPRNQRV